MTDKRRARVADIRGYSRLAVDATIGLANLVETMHRNLSRPRGAVGVPAPETAAGIPGLVYRSIRGVTRLVGGGIDAVLSALAPQFAQGPSTPEREAVLAALNGVLGDYLADSGNSLAIPMRWRKDGTPLDLAGQDLAAAIPRPGGKVLLLAHGLCMNDLQWRRKGHDHGAALAADAGYTPMYLHYNSGLHISANGRALAEMIESLLAAWPVPVEELVILGHSMGGLLARSACHYGGLAGHRWPQRLRSIVFLGSPHHGAPLERGGNRVDAVLDASPYTAAFARLGKVRSAGITDLRYGNLLDEDWMGRDRFAPAADQRRAVPLPQGVMCCAIAASVAKSRSRLREIRLGDGLVPLRSALGQHANPELDLCIPESQQWIGYGMNHLDLLSHRDVYAQIRQWLAPRR